MNFIDESTTDKTFTKAGLSQLVFIQKQPKRITTSQKMEFVYLWHPRTKRTNPRKMAKEGMAFLSRNERVQTQSRIFLGSCQNGTHLSHGFIAMNSLTDWRKSIPFWFTKISHSKEPSMIRLLWWIICVLLLPWPLLSSFGQSPVLWVCASPSWSSVDSPHNAVRFGVVNILLQWNKFT